MSHYRAGRMLASIVVWAGFIGVGVGLLVTMFGMLSSQVFTSGSAGVVVVVWGAMAALLGNVSRAIFDIADKVRGDNGGRSISSY